MTATPHNSRPGRQTVVLAPGVTLAPDVRITLAPPTPPRWGWGT